MPSGRLFCQNFSNSSLLNGGTSAIFFSHYRTPLLTESANMPNMNFKEFSGSGSIKGYGSKAAVYGK
jgi:hypothetical protein